MSPVQPIPAGYPRLSPYLSVDGAARAIDFYTEVLGATVKMRMDGPDGAIGHAELALGDSILMLADEYPDMGHLGPARIGGTAVLLQLYVEDVDATFERALANGAKALRAGGEPVLRRPVGHVRGPVRPPLERGQPRRGHRPQGDGPPGRAGRRWRLRRTRYGERRATGPRLSARSGASIAARSPTATTVKAPGGKRRRATATAASAVMPARRAGRVA